MENGAFEAFLAAVADVLVNTMDVEATVVPGAQPAPAGAPLPTIMVAIDINGKLTGVTWLFPQALVAEVAWQMLGGADVSQDLLREAAAELANMLTGRAMEALEALGFKLVIAPPRTTSLPLPPGLCGRVDCTFGAIDVVFHGAAERAA
jgi:CheY-specific phosphatase CheX